MRIEGIRIKGERIVDASILTNDLVLWLDANNATSYPGTGTTVTDLSGNGNNHTLSSSGIYTDLSGVKCFNCTTTGVVTCNTSLTIPTNFTYISWARVIASTSTYRTLLRTSDAGHPIIINTGTNLLGMWDNATATGFNSSGYNMSGYATVWAQWVTTGTAAGQSFYINGQQVGNSVNKSDSGHTHFAWGNIHIAFDQPWGYVSNLFLYNGILTTEQIQQNYYGLKGTFGV